jgi:hypothetical protein
MFPDGERKPGKRFTADAVALRASAATATHGSKLRI